MSVTASSNSTEARYHYSLPLFSSLVEETLRTEKLHLIESTQGEHNGDHTNHMTLLVIPVIPVLLYLIFLVVFVMRHRSALLTKVKKPVKRESGLVIRFDDIIDAVIRYQRSLGALTAERYGGFQKPGTG